MAPAKKGARRKGRETPTDPGDLIGTLIRAALNERNDFILAFERDGDEPGKLHAFSGKLITPCMLGTLTNRTELLQEEGSRHEILEIQ